jgi:hypothetical protein
MTRPTPCQQCKADLAEARQRVAELENLVEVHVMSARDMNRQLSEAHARATELDAKCLANAQSYDEVVLAMQALSLAVDGYKAKLAAANALLDDIEGISDLPVWFKQRIRAHLSGQPAAPSLPAVGSKWRSLTTRPGSVWTVREVSSINIWLTEDGPEDASRICVHHLFSNHYEPAAPCRAESLLHDLEAWKGRTETEQAVLDACAAWDTSELDDLKDLGTHTHLAVREAELARRATEGQTTRDT